jgi:hypothetical protein
MRKPSMKKLFHPFVARTFCLLVAVGALAAVPARAQVPQDTTFTGRLVGVNGTPLPSPVNLELRIFDAEVSGTQLYSEQHLGVVLDASGGFSVQLGLGTSPSGSYGPALFSQPDRWLEVVVGAEVLSPREIIGAVPWSLIAKQANQVVPDPSAPRFEDCGNGTVADHKWGLQWEKKTGNQFDATVTCETVDCPNPHYIGNTYQFATASSGVRDGGAFLDFIARLNGEFDPDAADGCFANRCDWRIPSISELQTILIGPEAAPGQAATCSAGPCIDPGFAAVGGATRNSAYWGNRVDDPGRYAAQFQNGNVFLFSHTTNLFVRAVRTGGCH